MERQAFKSQLGKNLRFLRDRAKLTQKDLATIISRDNDPRKIQAIGRNIGSYEEGRAFPQPDLMMPILKHFNIDYQSIISIDLESLQSHRLQKVLQPGHTRLQILAVPVDANDVEKIAMVPEKAAAGYVKGYSDREYIKELESFHLPWLPTGATFRAFEISGDSMPPVAAGSVVLGKFVEIDEIKVGERYVLVTKEGLVFKRVYLSPKGTKQESLLLTSDNPHFAPYEVELEDVLEVWQFYAHIAMSQDK
ncbi:MAG: LexA family transcriptional regulator [Bacteroidota bacterium]